jgi:hypothetical protein
MIHIILCSHSDSIQRRTPGCSKKDVISYIILQGTADPRIRSILHDRLRKYYEIIVNLSTCIHLKAAGEEYGAVSMPQVVGIGLLYA